MPELCQGCRKLDLKRSDFTSPPFEPEGKSEAAVCKRAIRGLRDSKATCCLCGLIWHCLERTDAESLSQAADEQIWTLKWAQSTDDYQPSGEIDDVEDRYGSALYPSIDESRGYGMQLVDEKETKGFLLGRVVGEEIDLNAVARWIAFCQAKHGKSCTSEFAGPTAMDMALKELVVIDTDQLCLCRLPENAMYVALSYVWGDSNTPVTLLSNEEAFAEPGGLAVQLPRTVQDAIEVVRGLKLRYLWIDSICITQDDAEKKQLLVENMDTIYSRSHLTIVAATGNGAHSGLSAWSNKQDRHQHCIEIGENVRLGVLPYYQRELLKCEHARRAWTYQETSLSPRCLIFLNGFVYFNCGRSVYAEHIHAENVDGIEPEASANTLGKGQTFEWALQRYSQHVLAYSSRKLTYQSDGLNAFKGILKIGRPCYNVPFGMLTCCFDWSLLWTGRGSLTRRPQFPSWAWVGWQGEIHMPGATYGDYDQDWLLKATWMDWCYSTDYQGTTRYKIAWEPDGLFEHVSPKVRKAESGGVEPKPDGEEDEEEDPCSTYGTPTPGNPFGRRVDPRSIRLIPPKPKDSPVYQNVDSKRQSLLYFVAPSITLAAGATIASNFGNLPMASLFDSENRKCGFISVTDSDSWPATGTQEVKLLLISVTSYGDLSSHNAAGFTTQIYQAYGAEDHLEEYLEDLPEEVDNFDFLNVLYVQETGEDTHLTKFDADSRSVTVDVPVHERTGVGFIYREALRSVENIRWIDVVLA